MKYILWGPGWDEGAASSRRKWTCLAQPSGLGFLLSFLKHVPCAVEELASEAPRGTKGPLVKEVWVIISEIPGACYSVKGSEKSCSKETSSL